LKVLLDTNALIWLIAEKDGGQLGPEMRQLLSDAEEVYASSISVLEMRIKALLGKLTIPDELTPIFTAAGLKELVFKASHAEALKDFPDLARHDPFDRMLLAQAKVESLVFLTSDKTLLELDLSFIKNARH
jgi:PIN domain nuclease of toxin-antitoxin system